MEVSRERQKLEPEDSVLSFMRLMEINKTAQVTCLNSKYKTAALLPEH